MHLAGRSRRQFLGMGRNNKSVPVRPPWAMDESLFLDACSRCGDCLKACPESILITEGPEGYPVVDFSLGECTFCGDCVNICPTNALSRSLPYPWMVKAQISDRCLPMQQVICTTCGEQCDAKAITFSPQIGAVSQPELNRDVCSGCGACVAPCPVQAIEVSL